MELMELIIAEAMVNVNIKLVVALMGVGFIIKHVSFLDKISNSIIPLVLLVISLVFEYVDMGINASSTTIAIISTAIAIGLHQQGKNIFSDTLIPKVKEILENTFN